MKTTICLVLLIAAIFSDAGNLLAQSGKSLYTFPIGLQSYTYRNSFPNGVAATLDTIQALGVSELEGSNPEGTTPEEFRKMVDERNIKIPSIGVGYKELMENPEAIIEKAKILGASYVMVAWIPHDYPDFKFENTKKAVEDFNKVGKILSENGLTFSYHIHGYEFLPYQQSTFFDYMVKNTEPAYVSFELDILWAYFAGAAPVELLEKYGDRWKLVHLKDLKKGVVPGHSGSRSGENNVALGSGQIDIQAVLKAAKMAGIKHYFIEDESSRASVQVPQTIAYLKSLRE